jgi:beta-glucosidase
VAQLYVATPGRTATPLRSLKGFQRIHLRGAEERIVEFQLEPRDLAFADPDGVMRIEPGEYSIWVGGGQPNTGVPGRGATFEMKGQLALQP